MTRRAQDGLYCHGTYSGTDTLTLAVTLRAGSILTFSFFSEDFASLPVDPKCRNSDGRLLVPCYNLAVVPQVCRVDDIEDTPDCDEVLLWHTRYMAYHRLSTAPTMCTSSLFRSCFESSTF